jgi:YD repeat-containing protein
VTRQDFPNGTLTTTTFGAWGTTTLDPNDAIGSATAYVSARSGLSSDDPEKIALVQAQANAATPVAIYVDALGRQVRKDELIIEPAHTGTVTLSERALLDIRGLSDATIDRRALNASTRVVDRLGRVLREVSMDAGTHKGLFDAEGREVQHSHETTQETRTYDLAGRLIERRVTEGATTWLAEEITYGESASDAAAPNLFGRVALVKDAAGTVSTPRYGAFGEILETTRKLMQTPGLDPNWDDGPPVESTDYTTRTAFDALGRTTRAFLPDDTERLFTYLRSGPVTALTVTTPDFTVHTILASTEYNARGHRRLSTNGDADKY